MLILSRQVDEEILIGDDIRVVVVRIVGHKVHLGIDAPRAVAVDRPRVRRSKDATTAA